MKQEYQIDIKVYSPYEDTDYHILYRVIGNDIQDTIKQTFNTLKHQLYHTIEYNQYQLQFDIIDLKTNDITHKNATVSELESMLESPKIRV